MPKEIVNPKALSRPYSRWRRIDYPPVKVIESYLHLAGNDWGAASRLSFKQRIYRFYRWLKKSDLTFNDITLDTLWEYRRYLKENGSSPNSITQYKATINPFIKWLSQKGMLGTTLVDLELEKEKFPLLQAHLSELTDPYAIKIHKIYGYEFYVFLKSRRRGIEIVDKSDLRNYEQELRTQNPPRTVFARHLNMRCVHNHIRWLVKKGHLHRSLAELDISREKRQTVLDLELPEVAKDFLRLALAHKKPNTVRGYKTKLKQLYKYINDRQLSLAEFTRRDFEDFSKVFRDAGYSPVTINHAISAVQIYLTWLYQCGHLEKDPEPIIGNFSRPKRPDSLPRYLLPEVDALLQKHLDSSKDIVAVALNLMRRIGIRIGDLRNLRYDCLREDERGYWYAKIPIGKLNNERLFPLDDKALALIKKIKALSRKYNRGRDPEKLIIHPRGRAPGTLDYQLVLYEISEKLRLDGDHSLGDEPLVSHRLRHTFATSLLNAGMNVEGLQRLLGHRSLSMTLRYARVMPMKLREDYLKALDQLQKNVSLPALPHESKNFMPGELLEELLGRLRGRALEPDTDRKKFKALIRRTERLRKDLVDIH